MPTNFFGLTNIFLLLIIFMVEVTLSPLYHLNGILFLSLGVWIHPTRKPFGIINVYASNHGPDRNALWCWISLLLPHTIWILYTKYNMIEQVEYKVGCIPICWYASKWEVWFFLNDKYGLVNPNAYHITDEFLDFSWFTWPNFQDGKAIFIK